MRKTPTTQETQRRSSLPLWPRPSPRFPHWTPPRAPPRRLSTSWRRPLRIATRQRTSRSSSAGGFSPRPAPRPSFLTTTAPHPRPRLLDRPISSRRRRPSTRKTSTTDPTSLTSPWRGRLRGLRRRLRSRCRGTSGRRWRALRCVGSLLYSSGGTRTTNHLLPFALYGAVHLLMHIDLK